MATVAAERAQAVRNTSRTVATPSWVYQEGSPATPTGVLSKVAWLREWFLYLKTPSTDPASAPSAAPAEILDLELPELPYSSTSQPDDLEEREVLFTSDRDSITISPRSSLGAESSFRSARTSTTPASSLSLESRRTDHQCQDGSDVEDWHGTLQHGNGAAIQSTVPRIQQSSSPLEDATTNAEEAYLWTSHGSAHSETAGISLTTSSPNVITDSQTGVAGTSLYPIQLPLDLMRVEKLTKNCYMDRRAHIPETLVQIWQEKVRPSLDRDLQDIISKMPGQADHILSTTQFYMVGMKHGNVLLAEPTVVITCGTKQCRRRVSKLLGKLRLPYLEDFGRPIKVLYRRPPSYWAAEQAIQDTHRNGMMIDSHQRSLDPVALSTEGDPDSIAITGNIRSLDGVNIDQPALPQAFPILQNLYLQRASTPSSCGLQVRFRLQDHRSESQRICSSTLGGVIWIDGVAFGITTAHTFLVNTIDRPATPDVVEDKGFTSSGSDSECDLETERSTHVPRTMSSNTNVGRLHESELEADISTVSYSFLGRAATSTSTMLRRYTSKSDWAIFALPSSHILPNLSQGIKLRSIVPEAQLASGDVIILCNAGSSHKAYLTQSEMSIHTGIGVMDA